MGNFLRLTNGVPRSFAEKEIDIYDQSLLLVTSSPGAGQILGPITTGTSVTLPASQQYSSSDLQIYLNGDRLETVYDYNYVGSPPRTAIQFTFDLVVGDRIDFRIERTP